jgi:hypothetical protein
MTVFRIRQCCVSVVEPSVPDLIHVFFGLPDLDPDPLVRGMDPDPAPDPALNPALDPDPDPSLIMQN